MAAPRIIPVWHEIGKRCDGSEHIHDGLMAECLNAPDDDHLAAPVVTAKLVVECGDTLRPVHAALAIARARFRDWALRPVLLL